MRDINNFQSGIWRKQLEYKSFSPNTIHTLWVLSDPAIVTLLSHADRNLGKLDAFSDLVPDIDFFIKMHITKEATVSSKIEGTQTSFKEALARKEDLDPERRDDWLEVHAYIDAMNQAMEEMKSLPISSRLIRNTHAVLLMGVRGEKKMPGEFRTSQNWIGPSLRHAVFVPPVPGEINELMGDLEEFIHDDELQIPHLIKIAIVHYQFETIHPFLDGNGRIGRLLITLYLLDKGLLKYPTLYLSDFFERNRRDYYDNLMRVRDKNDLGRWISFFLQGVIETTESGIQTFQEIIQLREKYEFQEILKLGKKQKEAKKLLTELYRQPIIDVPYVEKALGVHNSTANRLIRDFMSLGILEELTGFKRNRVFAFREYINIF